MKIFAVDQNGDLTPYAGQSLVIKFNDGKILELNESPEPFPASIPEGLMVWGGRVADLQHLQLNITPVASNGIIIAPCRKEIATPIEVTIFISDENADLHSIQEKNVVIELKNGKTLEVLEDYAQKGLLVWGGREPIPGLPIEKAKERTESVGIYPMGGNVIYVFPFKVE
ncbi:hypothetical protein [Acinetobacter sp.]|jgi:hypothetical protein|uniref:hypothetical protein n=1 Tax=Acinetobacter sp. TaxID=472 RepID=UPI00282D20CA|nr:hypothetical protein [Acinetobacter sp.]MDR2250341.1 hypothetical protein [Acinetobacter sp.]